MKEFINDTLNKYMVNIKSCLKCGNELMGKQEKFCSNKCRSNYHNYQGASHKKYINQKDLGYNRKEEFIKIKGGGCKFCGYNKCYRALTFHHRDTTLKEFTLDIRNLSNRSYDKCLQELEKCDLLCFNCHMELHEFEIIGAVGIEPTT